jgi:hypothetical protein
MRQRSVLSSLPIAPVWVLPEIRDPDLLWPGLSTEELSPGVFTGGQAVAPSTATYLFRVG